MGATLGLRASVPPPPLYSAGATGAHNPIGLGSPDQGAEARAQLGRWTESVEINTNETQSGANFLIKAEHDIVSWPQAITNVGPSLE